ncbi:MAG: thiamine pyrophosphate-binding protein [Hyphomicrobiaceae bacterium]|nr:MAG: thiamine pyrophosphate-binding protein [Hyphomicrobiaceae bacterium]
MTGKTRGADIVARALDGAGYRTVFTLSGNHIMPVFDAAVGTRLKLIHVRHEAAAVHMADAWARLTGDCGIALVTGGAGHTNAVAALCTAQAADAPLVLLSGHAGTNELGRGAFQELRQADMAEPVTKASWTASSIETLGHDIAKAVRIAKSGRPGPVHVSLPVDLLEGAITESASLVPEATAFAPQVCDLDPAAADAALDALAGASRPLILAGPMLCRGGGAELLRRLARATGVPALGMESPRGINDPRLGAFAEVLARADLILLLGKPHDFTIRFADPPFVDPHCRFVAIDPDPRLIARVAREKGERLVHGAVADAAPAAETLTKRASGVGRTTDWAGEVAEAIDYRPAAWATHASQSPAKVHPLELCRAVQPVLERNKDAVLVCDGGEIGQWPQAVLAPSRRVINGVSGSIGASIPFAIAARLAEPKAPVIAVMGDGTFGFHMAEFDTAVRCGLPFVAVVGNDATWNAEYQIQMRSYGRERTHGCELLPARYDQVAAALGGHGEYVTTAAGLEPALERAIASGKPACVNVMIERVPAPVIRRPA